MKKLFNNILLVFYSRKFWIVLGVLFGIVIILFAILMMLPYYDPDHINERGG